MPAIEIGWRLAFEHWGKGYATEGARAVLEHGFERLKLDEIVSFTTVQNIRSRSVMEKIGMHRDPKDDSTTRSCLMGIRLDAVCSTAWEGGAVNSFLTPHCISVFVICKRPEPRYLLIRRCGSYLPGTWQMVSGKIEEGETRRKPSLERSMRRQGLCRQRFIQPISSRRSMKSCDKITFVPVFAAFVESLDVYSCNDICFPCCCSIGLYLFFTE